ncbi:MAG: chemotaxis protein CheW [Chloroflexota bacterium]
MQFIQIAVLRQGRQYYALPIHCIVQIIEMVEIAPLPEYHGVIEGVINYHTTTLPVARLSSYLGLPPTSFERDTPILIAVLAGKKVGLIVDEVLDVREQPLQEILRPDQVLPADCGEARLLTGLWQAREGTIFLLDVQRMGLPRPVDAPFAAGGEA